MNSDHLRSELVAEVAKAKQGGGIAYRLGWVLYWIFLALAAGSLAAASLYFGNEANRYGLRQMMDGVIVGWAGRSQRGSWSEPLYAVAS